MLARYFSFRAVHVTLYSCLTAAGNQQGGERQDDFSPSGALCEAVRNRLRLLGTPALSDITVVRKSFDARRVRGERRCCWTYVLDISAAAVAAARPRRKLEPLTGQLERCCLYSCSPATLVAVPACSCSCSLCA